MKEFSKKKNKVNMLTMSITLSLILIIIIPSEAKYEFLSYPLANQYFDLIYELKSPELKDNLFLHISCKQVNLLSISISNHLQFDQAPRFPIHSKSIHAPKFQQDVYTFLSGCHSQFKINTTPDSIIKVVRKQNNQTIFQLKDLKLSEGHHLFTVVDNSIKWGLGERFQQKFKITDGHWTIFNRDKPWKIDRGTQGRSEQTYGHQPLYLARQYSGNNFHLSYFKNTHGMLIESGQNSNELKYNSVGGNIQFLIFLGGKNPQIILQKYHNFIGKIHIPPFWSLGWHQCRWGYQNLTVFQQVVAKYQKNDIPLDTMWTDLDYMDRKQIFTLSQAAYPSVRFNNLLEQKSLHYIPLIDVGVSIHDQISIIQGTQMDVFLKDVNSAGYYVGEVWPGKVYFVDYLHPNASKFWQNQLGRLYQRIKFSGVWLDMNQPSNFKGNQPIHETYKIQQGQSINMMTIDVGLKHYNNYHKNQQLFHNEVHAYFGHLSTVPTHEFLSKHGRPFIISRSNSVGTGAYAGHWTGDNNAQWPFLRLSISGNFLFQIFGIQMVGADICGFHLNTTEQLCSRWTQLGALYPFARNHNQDVARSQQPFTFGEPLLKTAQSSIKLRYSILKQLYSILVDLKGKGSFFRPLFFEFFDDQKTYQDEVSETQFLLGKYFMSAPIVEQGKSDRNVYFPKSNQNEKWYTLQFDPANPGLFSKDNTLNSKNKNNHFYEGGKTQHIKNQIPSGPVLFLRDGHMIFSNTPTQRSRFLNNQFFVTAALNEKNIAENRFLAIENYQNQTLLSQCINNSKCMMNLQIQKTGQQNFKLTWKFQGQKQAFGRIQLKHIVVWKQDEEWIYQNAAILLQSTQGSKQLQLKKRN